MKPLNRLQVAAFRLSRHHLADRSRADLVAVCRDVCGIQAQVMSAARTALWARIHELKPARIDAALCESRALVKTSCMRQTLHVLPAEDFPIYISALKQSRIEALRRTMSKFEVTEKDADQLNEAVLEALAPGPMTQRELAARVKPIVGKSIRSWMEHVWSVFRLPLVEGLICYGPDQGAQVTFVRVDQWLPRLRSVAPREANQILLRRYLGAYGPATVKDFSHWSGIPGKEAKPLWESLNDELIEVSIEDNKASMLREDCRQLLDRNLRRPLLKLLPGFDPYLLAHAEKDHLVSNHHYKRVYRNQGWISPVVLLDGRVIGIWSVARRGKASSHPVRTALRGGPSLEIELFEKISRTAREKIEEEAASLGAFLQMPLQVSVGIA